MPFLLDTNVLSELRRGNRCDPKVAHWASTHRNEQHYISVLTIGEICKGIEMLRKRSPEQCPAFEDWLETLRIEYPDQILPISEAVSERWGRLMAERTLPVIDGLIAATALTHKLTVATRNVVDFANTGVKLVSCPTNKGMFAGRNFCDFQGASDAPVWGHTGRASNAAATSVARPGFPNRKNPSGPWGCDENGPAPALLLTHVSQRICSFAAPWRRAILIATNRPLFVGQDTSEFICRSL